MKPNTIVSAFLKSTDIKTIIIIVLCVGLFISFIVGQKNGINTHNDEIKALESKNTALVSKNDSLISRNVKIDALLVTINKKLDDNYSKLVQTNLEIKKLKASRNEIPTHVNQLSANDVADELSTIIDERKNSNHSN